MSRKADPPSRSAGEQLRMDHIETLELLQQTKTENKALKLELKALKALKGKGKGPDCAVEEAEEMGVEVEDGCGLDLLELVEQNTKVQEELKLTKARLNQAERDLLKEKQASSSTAAAQIASLRAEGRKRESSMADAVVELEELNGTLRSELGEAVGALQRAEEDLIKSRREVQEMGQMGAEWEQQQEQYGAFRAEMGRIEEGVAARIDKDRRNFQLQLEAKTATFEKQLQQLHQVSETNTALRREAAAQVEVQFGMQQRLERLGGVEETCAKQLDRIAALTANAHITQQAQAEQAQVAEAAEQEPQGDTFFFTAPAYAVVPTLGIKPSSVSVVVY
jgi:hypothetical protein